VHERRVAVDRYGPGSAQLLLCLPELRLGRSEPARRSLLADEARRLYDAIEQRFASSTGARWIWDHLRNPGVSRQLAGDGAFERLAEIVPNATAQLLYFPGSDEDVVAAYRGTIDAIAAVIGDCSFHEYVVSPLGAEWFVCENHHGVVIAVGEPVESRLRMLSRYLDEEPRHPELQQRHVAQRRRIDDR
jgi:hypothetical protein